MGWAFLLVEEEGRRVSELEREKDFFGLVHFAAERLFQLRG